MDGPIKSPGAPLRHVVQNLGESCRLERLRAGRVETRAQPRTTPPALVASGDFTTFNFKAPARCTLIVTATAVVSGGSNDPTPENNVALVELSVVDRNDTEQVMAHETTVKSHNAAKMQIPDNAAVATKVLTARIGNADYKPVAESPGDSITLNAGTTCTGLSLGTPVCDPVGGGPSVEVRGGVSKVCKITATASASQVGTPNKLSPQRCTVTLDAIGPDDPEPAPHDASNNRTEFSIDILDQNDH